MEKFAKIIDTDARQILVTKQWNAEKEQHEVKFETNGSGARLSAAIAFDNEEAQNDFFEKADPPFSEKIITQIFDGLL